MKTIIITLSTALFTTLLIATTFIHRSLDTLPTISTPIHFTSTSGAFTYRAVPAKGSDANTMEAKFEKFKKKILNMPKINSTAPRPSTTST